MQKRKSSTRPREKKGGGERGRAATGSKKYRQREEGKTLRFTVGEKNSGRGEYRERRGGRADSFRGKGEKKLSRYGKNQDKSAS